MTVKELIAALQELDPEAVVVLAKDAEGNHYSLLAEADRGYYVEDTTWAGDFHLSEDHADDDGISAVCLWPVN